MYKQSSHVIPCNILAVSTIFFYSGKPLGNDFMILSVVQNQSIPIFGDFFKKMMTLTLPCNTEKLCDEED